jgi:hypothetical protein
MKRLLLTLLFFGCFLNISSANTPLNINSISSPLLISLQIYSPHIVGFEVDFKGNIYLKGNYNLQSKDLKAEIYFDNVDLSEFKSFLKQADLKGGYLKKGTLYLQGKETFSLEGSLKLENVRLVKKDIELSADLLLLPQVIFSDKKANYSLDVNVSKGKIKSPSFEEISLRGNFNLSSDKLIVKESYLNYKDTVWQLKGDIKDFASPKIDFDIETTSVNLKIKAHYNKEKQEIETEELILRGKKTKISSKANMILTGTPRLRLEGIGKISLEDIVNGTETFKLNYPLLKKLNPQGEVSVKFIINGGLNPKTWEVKLAGDTPNLIVYGINTKKVKIELYKNKDEFTISPFVANYGGGNIDFRIKLDFLNKKKVINLILNNISLTQVRKDFNLKNKKLAGKLSLEVYLKDNRLAKLGNLEGEGVIYIEEGNLWEINLFKGLGKFLFIPDFEIIRFKEGYSDIIFRGKDIVFENIKLTSPQISLEGAGKISLNRKIEFMFFPQFAPNLISSSEGLKKIITTFLGQRGLAIEVKGTLKKPLYKVKPMLLSPLKGIKDFFNELLK